MILYKIKRHDGLYSAGGTMPKFTSNGKFWRKNHLHAHLNNVININTKYQDCQIVEYDVIETGRTFPIGKIPKDVT